MTDLSILDMNMDNIQEPRNAPPGRYLAVATNYKIDKIPNEKGTVYGDIEFRLKEPLDGQDLNGVNMDRPIYGRVWLTVDSVGLAKRELNKFGQDLSGISLRESFDKIVGSTVVVTVALDEYAIKKNIERPVVTNWATA